MRNVSIIGVGLHPFGRYGSKQALDMGAEAVNLALIDAGIEWSAIQRGYAGSHEVSNPDAIVGKLGLTGIPFFGVFNGCATGNTSLTMAAESIEHGDADIAIAVGFDKHPKGAFGGDPSVLGHPSWYGETGMFMTTHFFGMKINRYMNRFGIMPATLARVAAKNFRNGERNENAWRRTVMSEEAILGAPYLNYPLTQYMYCAPNEGAAAVVLCRRDLAPEYSDQPIHLVASVLRTRRTGAFEMQSPSLPVDGAPSPSVDASKAAYEIAGVAPSDVHVAQLQDTDAGSEIIHMAENGFCADGDQEKLIAEGHTELDGILPINTDGGLMANGEPIGASGLRQIHEIVVQLRGRGGNRQIQGPHSVGYTHLYGSPGTGAVTILTT
ncbi:thiolase family protein [Rhodococcoides fascians]|uniref:thiolase family protein n=1 Tax=Rhodococcoides fascians TaxID=1828 RepID=UPI00050C5A1A|nr:thiolase family protein [Rhodococcus fascians]